MKRMFRLLDRLLQRIYGVFEFTDDPECLFRLSVTQLSRPLLLDDRTISAGAEVLILHFWNERMPQLSKKGSTLAEGVQSQRQIIRSLRAVAVEIQRSSRLANVQAVGGVTALITTNGPTGTEKLFRHLGFTIVPYHNPLGRFGLFWENLYSWLLIWTYNEAGLRRRPLLNLVRTGEWMTVQKFLARYAVQNDPAQG